MSFMENPDEYANYYQMIQDVWLGRARLDEFFTNIKADGKSPA